MGLKINSVAHLVDLLQGQPITFRENVTVEKTIVISQTITTKIITLTDEAVIYSFGNLGATVFEVTLEGNRELAGPESCQSGTTYKYIIKQDGTGNRTLAYNAVFKFPGGTTPTLSTGANEVDVLTALFDGTNFHAELVKDFS